MKMNRIANMALTGLCVLGAADAYAGNSLTSMNPGDSVAVMRIDATGANADKAADALLEAIRKEVTKSEYTLDSNGSDISYKEMQDVTGCEEAVIGCYDSACGVLGSKSIIFGEIAENGDAHVVWHISGKGIFREATAKLTDKAAVDKLARDIVIGEVGHVIVTSNIPGADVFIDGKRVGMSAEYEENAQPIELVTGNYVVAVRKDGFTKEDAVSITIKGGETSHVHVDMSVMKDPEEIRNAIKIAGFTTLGVGAAALIGAGVVETLQYLKQDEMDKHLKVDRDCGFGGVDCKDMNDKGNLYHKIKIGLFAGGGFLAAAGVALTVVAYVYDFEGEDVDKAYSNKFMPKVDVSLSPEYQGMSLGWTF